MSFARATVTYDGETLMDQTLLVDCDVIENVQFNGLQIDGKTVVFQMSFDPPLRRTTLDESSPGDETAS